MSSKRLPMKMLKSINNKLLLDRVYCQVKKVKSIKKIIVATSTNTKDDMIFNFCKKNEIEIFRGPLNDVSKRFIEILEIHKPNYFVRINGDSPFILPSIIVKGIDLFENNNVDLVTNIFPRSFPKGLSVEIIRSKKFIESYPFQNALQKEHVTNFFYKNFKHYKIKNFKLPINCNDLSLSVDTYHDLLNIRKISKIFDNNELNIEELINLTRRVQYLKNVKKEI